jgi:two-component system, sensor histidine kinase PdtaS
MFKVFFLGSLCCLLIMLRGLSQTSATTASTITYHPASEDKESWQRLNLCLSMNFYRGMKLLKMDFDSSLLVVSRSLGLSRLALAAEGIDNPELLAESKWFDQRDPAKGVRMLSAATGKKHLELMILLGSYYTFQPASYKKYKDSVEHYLKKALTESKAIKEERLGRVALCLLGKLYAYARDTINANAIFTQLINECRSAGDKRTEARALAYRGLFTQYYPGNMQTRLDYLSKASEIYHELGEIEGEIAVNTFSALLYMAWYKIDDSYKTFIRALHLADSIHYPYTHYNADHLAMITMFQGKFGEPLKYALQSVQVSEAVRDSIGWSDFYLRLAQLYYMEGGRSEESLKWMTKALNRFIRANDGNVHSTVFNVVSLMNENPGREQEALNLAMNTSKISPPENGDEKMFEQLCLATCYMSLKQYGLALQHLASADSLEKVYPNATIVGSYRREAIRDLKSTIHFYKGDYAIARKYLEEYLADSTHSTVLDDMIRTYQRLVVIDSAFNDPVSGVKHYKKFIELMDSNFKASKLRQAEELQVIYQTKEKEGQIAVLNEQAKVKQANLKRATLLKNVTIGGIIAALIIAGLLYRQSRLRKKTNLLIMHKNDQLQHFLTEKEWLLKEIHHRVKNNLQIVMSLLNSQSAFIDNKHALTAIHDSQHRVHAMSLIHQKLYSTDNVSSIDMSLYIRELTAYLADSFDTGQRIRFEFAIDPLVMDVSQAVPLGLILNEAITNSIKYAFPGERTGVVSISLNKTSPDHYLLRIADNGIGIPDHHLDSKKPGSLGMSLMGGLSEDLDGKFSIENNNGTIINISFVHDPAVKRPDLVSAAMVSTN